MSKIAVRFTVRCAYRILGRGRAEGIQIDAGTTGQQKGERHQGG